VLQDVLRALEEDASELHRHAYLAILASDLPPSIEGQDTRMLLAAHGVRVLSIPFSLDDLLEGVREAEQRLAAAN
jgi:hypothetical protein